MDSDEINADGSYPYENAEVYKDSLERAFIEKWNRLVEEKAQLKRGHQETLFNENGGQKKLIE